MAGSHQGTAMGGQQSGDGAARRTRLREDLQQNGDGHSDRLRLLDLLEQLSGLERLQALQMSLLSGLRRQVEQALAREPIKPADSREFRQALDSGDRRGVGKGSSIARRRRRRPS